MHVCAMLIDLADAAGGVYDFMGDVFDAFDFIFNPEALHEQRYGSSLVEPVGDGACLSVCVCVCKCVCVCVLMRIWRDEIWGVRPEREDVSLRSGGARYVFVQFLTLPTCFVATAF